MNAALFDISSIPGLPRADGENEIRTRCEAQYLGGGELLGRCLGRFKIFLDARDLGFAPHILADGYWEYWITQFVASKIARGSVVLDVGANFGYYTLLISELVGPVGKCLAFEPNPAVAAKLRKTIEVNGFAGRARVLDVALGKNPGGETSFFIPHHEPKNGMVLGGEPHDAEGLGTVISVPQTNLDTACRDLTRLDFVKIDAEGAEADIIEGMTDVIAHFRPSILLEFNAARAYDGRALAERLRDVYGRLDCVDFDGQLKPVTIERLMHENHGQDWMLYFAR
ncbi:FkbM family methyltransferase [Phreatobacter sp. AB_2022a]|uniref:FkbM family methyltransferase n=1 Tax=Phreatobacter sp. AB_2022a TaxID=3003134 RepID=UPI0022871544|nr:FkbM family methyltransferase [Phreatobacter sp. AB_2022a]MCZ0733718.1 FkbM family methyltransferase [Phreatobacter sp. AB_2022a]